MIFWVELTKILKTTIRQRVSVHQQASVMQEIMLEQDTTITYLHKLRLFSPQWNRYIELILRMQRHKWNNILKLSTIGLRKRKLWPLRARDLDITLFRDKSINHLILYKRKLKFQTGKIIRMKKKSKYKFKIIKQKILIKNKMIARENLFVHWEKVLQQNQIRPIKLYQANNLRNRVLSIKSKPKRMRNKYFYNQ